MLLKGLQRPEVEHDPARYTMQWRRALKQAKVPPVPLHSLRHLAVSVLLDAGVPLSEVAAQVGHARTSTTTDRYGHLVRDRAAERGALLGQLITPQKGKVP